MKKKYIFILLFFAFILRLIWIILIPTEPISDFLWYHNRATEISQGLGYVTHSYPTAFWGIGYPGFLGFLYFLFEPNIIVGKIANIILSSSIIFFTYKLANKIFGTKIALLSSLILSVDPRQISYTSVLGSEILFSFVFILVNYIYFSDKKYKLIYVGFLIGISALIKPYMLIYPVVIFILEFIHSKGVKHSLLSFFITTCLMILTISPWTIRNYIHFNSFIPVSNNGGYVLYLNNNPRATGSWTDPFKYPNSPFKKNSDGSFDEVYVDKTGKKLAIKWIKENPKNFLILGIKRIKNVFGDANDIGWAIGTVNLRYKNIYYFFANSFYKIKLILFGFFILTSIIYKNFKSSFIHINLFFFLFIFFIFEGQPRYLFPMLPYINIGASIVLTKIFINSETKN